MADTTDLNYYILFENYTHGLALQELLQKKGLPSRIAPTPRTIQGELSCGMSLLIEASAIKAVTDCIKEHKVRYYSIVEMPCQINPYRGKFC
ncbi:MAG: DUF3343 domain-containing protein [Acetivibrio ethanolgignens]